MGYLVMCNLNDVIKETRAKRRNSEGGSFGLSRKREMVKKWVPLFQ